MSEMTDAALTEQHVENHAEIDPGQEIQIEIQNFISQVPSEDQDHGTSSTGVAAIHPQPDATSEDRLPMPLAGGTQEEDQDTKVAICVTQLAAGGVLAVSAAGFIGKGATSSMHKLFFMASMISMCASFVSGGGILLFEVFWPNIPCLRVIVKILMIGAFISMALAVGFGVTFYFGKA